MAESARCTLGLRPVSRCDGQPSVTWTALSSGPSPPTGASAVASMSSAVRSVPESVGGVVSRSWSSCASARCGSSAGPDPGRVVGDLPGEPAVEGLALGLLEGGRAEVGAGARPFAGQRGELGVLGQLAWWGSRRWRPPGGPRPPGRCRGRSGPRAASCVPPLRGSAPTARSRPGGGPVSDSRPTRDRRGHARVCGAARRRRRACAAVGGSARPWRSQTRSSGSDAPVRRWARTQKREYTNGEERPLAGDLGAMGVYVGLVSAAAAAVRASGRELPERIPVGDALLLTVATFRLARRHRQGSGDRTDPGAVHPVRGRLRSRRGGGGGARARRRQARGGGAGHLPVLPGAVGRHRLRVRLRHRAEGHPPGGADDDDGRGLRRPPVRLRRDPERRARTRRPRASTAARS